MSSIYIPALSFAIMLQAVIVFYGKGFTPEENFLRHSYLAKYVLNHFPAIYNPTKEIFAERTQQREEPPPRTPVVYYYNNKCRKALVKEGDEEEFRRLYGDIPERYKKFFKDENNKEKMRYINF